MAFTIAYCEEVTKAGMDIDDFAPRLSFFFISHQDFFEQICKFRAARRVYAKIMAERFKARKPESMRLRVHVQTAAMSLTKVEHHNNLMRTAIQALGAVLGGCQSMHTNGLDEAFAIPTEEAMKLAIRTQQIIREEINVTSVIDPLGGSYFIERLTKDMETEIWKMLDEVEERGGIGDHDIDAAERAEKCRHSIAHGSLVRDVGRKRQCLTALSADFFGNRLHLLTRTAQEADACTMTGKRQRRSLADRRSASSIVSGRG